MKLAEMLDLLRSKGVTHFSGMLEGDAFSVTFGALDPLPTGKQPRSVPLTMSDVENCACGHAPYEHNGLCLHGCDPSKCIPQKERK